MSAFAVFLCLYHFTISDGSQRLFTATRPMKVRFDVRLITPIDYEITLQIVEVPLNAVN